MIHQYNPQRFTYRLMGGRLRHIGTVPVGTIITLRDPRLVIMRRPTKVIVEAWHNREHTAARRNAAGRWENTYMAGGHLATVRILRNGHRLQLSDHWLLRSMDQD